MSAARLWAVLALFVCAVAAPLAHAQNYPSKPVRFIIPSPPGSLADVLARFLAPPMGEALGQPVIADNRPGAAGALASQLVAKSPGDGYTILIAHDGMMAINPFVYAKLGYEPLRDFQSVAMVARTSLVMVASPALGVSALKDTIQLAKSKPGSVNYASGGNGHPTHLAIEIFRSHAGLQMVHVPYKGTAPAVQALMGGEAGLLITGIAEALPHIKSGKLVALAASGPASKGTFPNLPELKELHSDLDLAFWFGVFAPRETPASHIAALNRALAKAADTPEVKKRLADFGVTTLASSPAEMDEAIKSDQAKYGPLVKRLNIVAE